MEKMEHGPWIDDLAIRDDDFPERYVKLPEGNPRPSPIGTYVAWFSMM